MTEYLEGFHDLASHIIDDIPLKHIHQKSLIINYFSTPRIVESNGRVTMIFVSQSLLKKLYYLGNELEVCPSNVYWVELLRKFKEPETKSQIAGRYFETGCLGMGADYEQVLDLERNKRDGSKTVDHLRIDNAIERFKKVASETGLIIMPNKENVQVKQKRLWIDPINPETWKNIEIWIEGTADLISPVCWEGYDLPACVIDLKLTKDRNTCFPPFCWGCPEEMDHTQAIMYSVLFELPFFYYVFDYRKNDPGHVILPVNVNVNHKDQRKALQARQRVDTLNQIIRGTIANIQKWEQEGWPKNPSFELCKNCPVFDCRSRFKIDEV